MFLFDFTPKGFLRTFASFHLSAGKFPPVLPFTISALCDKHLAAIADNGSDHFDCAWHFVSLGASGDASGLLRSDRKRSCFTPQKKRFCCTFATYFAEPFLMLPYNNKDIVSIFDYSKQLVNKCLRDFAPDADEHKGKGGLHSLFFPFCPVCQTISI